MTITTRYVGILLYKLPDIITTVLQCYYSIFESIYRHGMMRLVKRNSEHWLGHPSYAGNKENEANIMKIMKHLSNYSELTYPISQIVNQSQKKRIALKAVACWFLACRNPLISFQETMSQHFGRSSIINNYQISIRHKISGVKETVWMDLSISSTHGKPLWNHHSQVIPQGWPLPDAKGSLIHQTWQWSL